MEVKAEHGAAKRTAMARVSSRLSALYDKIQGLNELETDMALRRASIACICVAINNLSNNAGRRGDPTRTRKTLTPSTASLREAYFLSTGVHCIVKVAYHRVTGKSFVLKMPALHLQEVEDLTLDLLKEACFMAACRGHPAIVRFHAVGEHRPQSGQYCLIMEDVVGTSLRQELVFRRRGKPFPENDVRRMMRQVMSGAKAMHDRDIVHRAIIPEHVLMPASGVVKIGGFGQAVPVSSANEDPYWVATNPLWYRAPEALLLGRGAFQSELIDSWSIGCLMAELVTGKVLFVVDDDVVAAQLRKIFDVLHIPGKETIKEIQPRDTDLAEEVSKWRTLRRQGKQPNHDRLRELVPRDVLSDDGFEVLRGLLMLNPNRRLTVSDALQLPWFAHEDEEPPAAAVSQVTSPWPFSWLLIGGVLAALLGVLAAQLYAFVHGRY